MHAQTLTAVPSDLTLYVTSNRRKDFHLWNAANHEILQFANLLRWRTELQTERV